MARKITVIAIERTEYTLDLISHVYAKCGVHVVFADELRWSDLFALLRDNDAVVVNSYTEIKNAVIFVLNALFYHKRIGIDADSQLEIPRGFLRRILKKLWLGWLFARPWCWGFAGGNESHKAFYRYYGMGESHIRLMPMMVDNARFERYDVKQKNDSVRFGYLGRLVPHKNVDLLVKAMVMLVERGFSVRLDVIGKGPEDEHLRKLVCEQGIADRVRFLGYLEGPEKVRALHSLDCLVLPSSYEPWGLVVNEALASGIPVVVSDSVGARFDLVEGCGLVVKTGDVSALADGMRKIAEDSVLRQEMGEQALVKMRDWDYNLYLKCWRGWVEGD